MALNTVQAVLVAYASRLQDLEDVTWAILAALSDPTFASITGDLADKVLFRLTGETRDGRSDADYQAAARIRVRVNRSRGKAEDVIAVARLAAIHSTPFYSEPDTGEPVFEVDIPNLPGAAQVAKLLGQAKPAGVRGILVYSTDALDAFSFGDATNATNAVTGEQFADAVGLTGPAFPSGVRLSAA